MAAALNWSLRIELVKRIEGRPILSVFRPRKMPRERQPPLKVGGLVRGNRIFPQSTRREMKNVHLFFLKLFGCMICEAKANGHEVPIGRRSRPSPSSRDPLDDLRDRIWAHGGLQLLDQYREQYGQADAAARQSR